MVSIASVTDQNPTPRPANPVTVSIRCGNDRPNRSNRHTTNVSPRRNESNAAASSDRSSREPDAWSVNTRQHPATPNASSCNAGSCTAVDTRAYPTRCPAGLGFRGAGRFRAGGAVVGAVSRIGALRGAAVEALRARLAPLALSPTTMRSPY